MALNEKKTKALVRTEAMINHMKDALDNIKAGKVKEGEELLVTALTLATQGGNYLNVASVGQAVSLITDKNAFINGRYFNVKTYKITEEEISLTLRTKTVGYGDNIKETDVYDEDDIGNNWSKHRKRKPIDDDDDDDDEI